MAGQDEALEIEELAQSGLFDTDWYLARYHDVAAAELEPLPHYYRHGSREGRQPNRYFDPVWYREQYPDVASAGVEPLLHYLRHGDHEGRRPMRWFDPHWYRAAYDLPREALALWHFLVMRDTGRFVPSAQFYAVPLLSPYKDDPRLRRDPVDHYLQDMQDAGLEPLPDLDIVARSGLLDKNHYLLNASDVHAARAAPYDHYVRYGWRENRRPNIYFDVQWYIDTNPDLARLKVNPLVHYALQGEARNRRPVPYFDPAWYRRTYNVPPQQLALAHYLAHRRTQAVSPTPLFDPAWFIGQHPNEIGPNQDAFAHYLQIGTVTDAAPSAWFDAASYRRRYLGRTSRAFAHLAKPERDNPLVHYLIREYARRDGR